MGLTVDNPTWSILCVMTPCNDCVLSVQTDAPAQVPLPLVTPAASSPAVCSYDLDHSDLLRRRRETPWRAGRPT